MSTASGAAHIYGVIGPDEYHEPVDDNAFTNVLARWNLRRAAAAAAAVDDGAVDADEQRALARASPTRSSTASTRRPGVYEEFAGFFELEPLLIRDIAPRRPITADLLLGRERVHRAQIVKQADVLMLHHLLPDEVAPGSLAANLDFYEPRTAHGSSLSPGIHAALFAARRSHATTRSSLLRIAAGIDVERPHADRRRRCAPRRDGKRLAGARVRLRGPAAAGDALVVDPRLPDAWPALEIARPVPRRAGAPADRAGCRSS